MKQFYIKLMIAIVVVLFVLFMLKRKEMTFRQSLLKAVYPIVMFLGKVFPSKHAVLNNDKQTVPLSSFYDFVQTNIQGDTVHFSQFKGKKIMIVNTASDCGFTAQYEQLERLSKQFRDKLVVIGFPANDFKNQEKGDNQSISKFCKLNYGVTFLLMKKTHVVKGPEQNEIFNWLSDSTKNGWCNKQPVWNFSKYLINENGVLTNFFSNMVSPLDKKVINAIQKK